MRDRHGPHLQRVYTLEVSEDTERLQLERAMGVAVITCQRRRASGSQADSQDDGEEVKIHLKTVSI